MEILELEKFPHADPSSHYCVDWLMAQEAQFCRERTLETSELTGVPRRSILGTINYKPLNELGSLGMIAEQPKQRAGLSRSTVETPAQLRVVEKLSNPKALGLPDTADAGGSKLAKEARYGEEYGASQLAIIIAPIQEPHEWWSSRVQTSRESWRNCYDRKLSYQCCRWPN